MKMRYERAVKEDEEISEFALNPNVGEARGRDA